MDIEAAMETCLIQNSPIRGKDLKEKLEKRGYKTSRAQFYRYGAKLKKAGKLEQTNGIWRWLQGTRSKSTILWDPAPKVKFEVTQQRGFSNVQLPSVATNLVNLSPYQLGIRLKVWVFLGGRNLGLVNDLKGYYNGKRQIHAEPDGGGFGNGCFSVPPECVDSNEELSLSFEMTITDKDNPSKSPYRIIGSQTHRRKLNDWFYEPANFLEDDECFATPENWDELLSRFSLAGANLIDLEIERQQTSTKSVIKGVMMFRGAKKLQETIKMYVPDEFEAYLFSEALFEEKEAPFEKNDKLIWSGNKYLIKDIENIYDAYSQSYRIAKLVNYIP
jgi:hypothetical protein